MKVLCISAVLPYPLHSGGQVRLYNLLKLLSKEHEITLYSYIRNDKEKELVGNLSFIKTIKLYTRGRVWQPKYLLRSMTGKLPLLLSSYEHQEMHDDILMELKKDSYDLVHCEPFYVYPALYGEIPVPVVIAEHNIEYEVYGAYVKQFSIPFVRPLLNIDVQKIKNQEQTIWKKAKRIISVSARDASVIGTVVDGKKISVIPNGVDTEYFRFVKKLYSKDNLKFLFVGNFLWMPNMKAVERLLYDMWPKVKEFFPKSTLCIVGKHLSKKLQEDMSRVHIEYKEFVDDIREEYKTSDILLAPMSISGGTKFKILEAMASGCLVLTTKAGMEGIGAIKNTHFLEAQTTPEFLDNIQWAIDNVKKSQTMAARARALIVLEYDWKTIAEKQSEVWKGIV